MATTVSTKDKMKDMLQKIWSEPVFAQTVAAINQMAAMEGDDKPFGINDVDLQIVPLLERTGCLRADFCALIMANQLILFSKMDENAVTGMMPTVIGEAYRALMQGKREPFDWVGIENGTAPRILETCNPLAVQLVLHELAVLTAPDDAQRSLLSSLIMDRDCDENLAQLLDGLFQPIHEAVSSQRLWRIVPEKLMTSYQQMLDDICDRMPACQARDRFTHETEKLQAAVSADRSLCTPDSPEIRAVLKAGDKNRFKI